MIKLIGQIAGRAAWAVGVFCVFPFLVGCQDIVTYSRKGEAEGMRLYSERMYGDAAGAFRQSIRQDPQNYHSHFYLGVCFEELKVYQQAFQEYYTSLEVMSHTPAGKFDDEFRLVVLDTLAAAIAQHDVGEAELNKAESRAKSGQQAEDWFLLAKVYRLKGDADLAMDCYRRAAKWDTGSFPIRKEFGLYLMDPINQRQEAEYFLRQAFRIEPNDQAVNGALARLGIVPLIGDKAKEPTPRIIPPYTGPLPSDVVRAPDGRVNLNATVAKPTGTPGSSNAKAQLPRD